MTILSVICDKQVNPNKNHFEVQNNFNLETQGQKRKSHTLKHLLPLPWTPIKKSLVQCNHEIGIYRLIYLN